MNMNKKQISRSVLQILAEYRDLIDCFYISERSKHILHVFNDYKSKRLYYVKETGSPFTKVLEYGGKSDHCANPELKWIEDFNIPITIVGLTQTNMLFVWRENEPNWKNLCWPKNKIIKVSDFDLNTQGLIICTLEGLCYRAEFSKTKSNLKQNQIQSSTSNVNISPLIQSSTTPLIVNNSFCFNNQMYQSNVATNPSSPVANQLQSEKTNNFQMNELKTEMLDLKPIPFISRCYKVSNDMKARNFFALQYHPNTNMRYYPVQSKSNFKENMKLFLDENMVIKKVNSKESNYNTENDYFSLNSRKFHDVEVKYGQTMYCLNKFILISRCPKFFSNEKFENKSIIDLEPYFNQKFNLQAFEIVINYIYTGDCNKDFIKSCLKQAKISNENNFIKFISDFKECFVDKFGLSDLKSSFDSSNYLKLLKESNINSKDPDDRLDLMSNFFKNLINQTLGSKLSSNTKKLKTLKFFRNSYTNLYDCKIECNNQEFIDCHKCILIARNDYLRAMFLGDWRESYLEKIKLPFDADLMQIFVDYLYTDEIQINFIHSTSNSSSSTKSKNEKEMEILFNLYVLSDQFLVERIKNLCEFKLANLVNLKNVVEIFEFSNEYEANQLKEFCMEFISLNLVTIIEAKQLESIDLNILKDLSKFYRNNFQMIASRMITPYSNNNIDINKIEPIPMDLIYDTEFVNSKLVDISYGTAIKNSELLSTSHALPPFDFKEQAKKEPEAFELASSVKSNTIDSDDGENDKSYNEKNQKWEKVRKKSRRKISEKDGLLSPQATIKTSPAQSNSASLLTANKIEKDTAPVIVKNSETAKVFKSSFSLEKSEDDWPELNLIENSDKKKKENFFKIKSSKLNKSPISTAVKQKQENQDSEQQIDIKPILKWGTSSASNNIKYNFIDVLNDEMKKVSLEEAKYKSPPKLLKSEEIASVVTKGWNLNTDKSKNDSFVKIIEMEKKSTEQYNKLKNRPLGLIQIEEKAIEDLKMLYDVENITTMTIRVELIDDLNFNLAPVWKKN